ncbi:hypothetical protein [Spirosoma jeollabukense]
MGIRQAYSIALETQIGQIITDYISMITCPTLRSCSILATFWT